MCSFQMGNTKACHESDRRNKLGREIKSLELAAEPPEFLPFPVL